MKASKWCTRALVQRSESPFSSLTLFDLGLKLGGKGLDRQRGAPTFLRVMKNTKTTNWFNLAFPVAPAPKRPAPRTMKSLDSGAAPGPRLKDRRLFSATIVINLGNPLSATLTSATVTEVVLESPWRHLQGKMNTIAMTLLCLQSIPLQRQRRSSCWDYSPHRTHL